MLVGVACCSRPCWERSARGSAASGSCCCAVWSAGSLRRGDDGRGYVAEIARRIRGRLIAFRQLAIILGLFLAGTINVLAPRSLDRPMLSRPGPESLAVDVPVPADPGPVLHRVHLSDSQVAPLAGLPGAGRQAAAVLRRVTGDEHPGVKEIRRSLGEGAATMGLVQILRSRWRGLFW